MKKILYLIFLLSFAHLTLSAQQQVTCGVFTFDVLITPVTCNGDCDGSIQITNISGGTPSYSYFWSTGSTVPSIFNLCADDYTVFISDAMGDTCSMTFTVTQPDSLLVFESVLDASCASCCDGNIVLMPTGGTSPYTYVFTPSNPPGYLCPGNYSYCVTDANGCSTCDTIVVSFSNPITFVLTVTPVSCFGSSNGSICVDSLSGGTPPYLYSWNTTPTQAISCATNLSAGTYTVCVTDSNGTTVCNSATVTEPAPIQVTETITDASCATCCDGAIVLTATGGTPPYTFTLNDSLGFSFLPPYSNLCPSTYTWCVSDANGCIACDTLVLSFPTSIINNNIATNFSIYPNPTNGTFTLEFLQTSNYEIELINSMGVKVFQEKVNTKLHTIRAKQKRGLYVLKITNLDDTSIKFQKIIIQ